MISGFHRKNEDGSTTLENGRLALFRNFDETTGNPLPRPNTLLIDSEQLEAGDALDDDFRGMAAIDSTTAYAMVSSADTGRIYKTTDRGRLPVTRWMTSNTIPMRNRNHAICEAMAATP